MTRNILSILVFAALWCVTSLSAEAAQGCGRDAYRGADGRCYLRGGAVVAEPGGAIIVAPPMGAGPGLVGTRGGDAAGRAKPD